MVDGLDLAHLSKWIGREEVADDVLTPSLAARFLATFDDPGPPPQTGELAPDLIHFCLALPAVDTVQLAQDGHPLTGTFLPPVPLARRMWASGSIEFAGELRVGDTVRRISRVADVTVKPGRSGALCFVTIEHTLLARGSVAITEHQNLVYRGASDIQPGLVATATSSPVGVSVEAVAPTPELLFRYSALTFNAHRIHYDLPYATDREHYSGLIVQGPLQATLLARLARRSGGGRRIRHFYFRGVSPAIAGETLLVQAGTPGENGLELWTSRGEGPVAMQALAQWR